MSGENVAIVRQAFEAYTRGDIDAVLRLCAEDIVITQAPEVPGASPQQHGHEGVLEAFGIWPEQWDDFRIEIQSIVGDPGDHVFVATRQSGRGKQSGVEVEAEFTFVFTVRDGIISEWRIFVNEDQAWAGTEKLSDADLVWNRATQLEDSPHSRPGDKALAALLLVHGQIMNGGLESALEYIEPDELLAGADGFAFFARDDLAAIVRSALAVFPGDAVPHDQDARYDALMALDEQERARLEQLDDDYHAAVPSDQALVDPFEAHYRAHPEDFAPLAPFQG